MESQSPIKQLLQRLSPAKHRDKPLPVAPEAGGRPSRQSQPLQTTSGNTSPSKINDSNPKSRLRSFLSRRQLRTRASPSPPRHVAHPKSPTHGIRKSFRNRNSPHDYKSLSKKVSNLEAQLKATQRELKRASAATSRHASRSTSVEREQMLDAEKLRKQSTSAGQEEEYEGLAHHLISQSYRDRQTVHRTLTYKSTDNLHQAVREQRALEDAESEEEEDDDLPLTGHNDPAARSELRQQSWNQIQAHLASERERERERDRKRRVSHYDGHISSQPPAKRSRRASSDDLGYARDKVLPPIHDVQAITVGTKPSHTRHISAPLPSQSKELPEPPLEITEIPAFLPPSPSTDDHATTSQTQPRKRPSNHRRRQSLVISRDDVDDALGSSPERPATRGKQGETESVNWTVFSASGIGGGSVAMSRENSPRRGCGSPSRLERVEEEYEWDEDVF